MSPPAAKNTTKHYKPILHRKHNIKSLVIVAKNYITTNIHEDIYGIRTLVLVNEISTTGKRDLSTIYTLPHLQHQHCFYPQNSHVI